ncbi:MAG: hypothetical protein K0S07_898 [Chlamydiales bacterium]|jgi:hypothetical protein|nr:hypothetical protein [Chlamydiales bacterium]
MFPIEQVPGQQWVSIFSEEHELGAVPPPPCLMEEMVIDEMEDKMSGETSLHSPLLNDIWMGYLLPLLCKEDLAQVRLVSRLFHSYVSAYYNPCIRPKKEEHLSEICAQLNSVQIVEMLDLSRRSDFSYDALKEVLDAASFKRIQKLNLAGYPQIPSAHVKSLLSKLPASFPHLKGLKLAIPSIDAQSLSPLLRDCSLLEELELTEPVDRKSFEAIATHAKKLKKLHLQAIDAQSLNLLLKGCSLLEELELAEPIDRKSFETIAIHAKNLKKLRLQLAEEIMPVKLIDMARRCRRLEELELIGPAEEPGLSLWGGGDQADARLQIAYAVRLLPALKKLIFRTAMVLSDRDLNLLRGQHPGVMIDQV